MNGYFQREDGFLLDSAGELPLAKRTIPGLPPSAVVPHSSKGGEPTFSRLRGVIKVGPNPLRWELFQLLLLSLGKKRDPVQVSDTWSVPSLLPKSPLTFLEKFFI